MDSIFANETQFDERLLELSATTDAFEGYANLHGKRIAVIADALAERFNFASHDRSALSQAALVHDLGALVMNRDYIKTNRLLREEERLDMQRHTVIGEQEAAKRGLSRAAQLLVRWHHEWWNGFGYPDALSGEQIPLAARILRVADTFCAITDARPFRAALSAAEAKKYLIEWAGIEFDPKIVKIFLLLEGLSELQSFDEREKTRFEDWFAAEPENLSADNRLAENNYLQEKINQ
ncbi:MAG: HD domain-containing protein [Pyrinomonadaceae bacterium]|nr:HD domain-containing protein [Pyrinomonadaceae bacterium]